MNYAQGLCLFVPFWSWQWSVSLPVPPLQVIGICWQSFACTARCPVKLQVDVVGPRWAAGLQATNACARRAFPCCVSPQRLPHPDFAIPTLASPLHFSVLPQTWISDAMKNKYHPSQLFIFHLADPTTHHCKAGGGWGGRGRDRGRERKSRLTSISDGKAEADPSANIWRLMGGRCCGLAENTCCIASRGLETYSHHTIATVTGSPL